MVPDTVSFHTSLTLQASRLSGGCSNSPSSKAAASEGPQAYPLGYVEGLNDARTKLADFFSTLLDLDGGRGRSLGSPVKKLKTF
jgi:hypothetical protein